MQSIALQIVGILFITVALPVSSRVTDKKRFAVLMFPIYLGVDVAQMLLLTESSVFDFDFWKVIVLQEVAGVWKNSGAKEYLMYLLRLQNDPFKGEMR